LAVLFGLAHALSLLYFALTVAMSLYLSWLLEATGNLAVPVLVHAFYDAIALSIMHKKDA
jgi:membrane protease YdiL (CAAX protease family)